MLCPDLCLQEPGFARLPPGLNGAELSWTAFAPQQSSLSGHPSSHWYRPAPSGMFAEAIEGQYGRYPSASVQPTVPATSIPTSLSWLTEVQDERPRFETIGVNGPFDARSPNLNSGKDGLWSLK